MQANHFHRQTSISTYRQQRGLSLIGWLFVITLLIVLGITALRLVPIYAEYYSLVKILQTMQTDTALRSMQKSQIAEAFRKRLDINDVRSLTRKDYKITKIQGTRSYTIDVAYEVRKPLFGNLSIVVSFQQSAEVGR